jgi:hypothetical protein
MRARLSVKVGDLVKTVFGFYRRGILVERIYDPLATHNRVFKVLWSNGTMGNNVWECDLEVISGIS